VFIVCLLIGLVVRKVPVKRLGVVRSEGQLRSEFASDVRTKRDPLASDLDNDFVIPVGVVSVPRLNTDNGVTLAVRAAALPTIFEFVSAYLVSVGMNFDLF
jgi:hypothetical protein